MKRIAIIGAGQAGLQLAIGLIKHNYPVTLVSDKSANEILRGRVTSSQALFHTALQYERELGLNFWEQVCPKNETVSLAIPNESFHDKAIQWKGYLTNYFQSVDQRLKFSAWMNEFERLGGNLVIQKADIKYINELSCLHDLILIATGKGELGGLFERDAQKSVFEHPMRSLALTYVNGMEPNSSPGVCVNIIPGVGEYFVMPGLGIHGPCDMMLFEGMINGPLDCWDDITSPEKQLVKNLQILERYLPWEAKRCKNLHLADDQATLLGRYTPVVRKPVIYLPSGKYALGMADAVVLNDPIAGQGANNAAKCAKVYMDSILAHHDKGFDKSWMQNTFNLYWQYATWATQWSNLLLRPPAPHVQQLLAKAGSSQLLANKLAHAFDCPADLFPWILDPVETKKTLAIITGQASPSLQTVLDKNTEFVNHFRSSKLMQLIRSESMNEKSSRMVLLDAIQLFSNHFQNAVMLRHVLTDNPTFQKITQQHLNEEFNHNVTLLADRNFKPPIWDPVLEASAAWFSWKMFCLDNVEKTLLMHLVLETSANSFFKEADNVMKKYRETNYFCIHVKNDEQHEKMGTKLLEGLTPETYENLLTIQKQGWDMLHTACDRIAELTLAVCHQNTAEETSL